MRWVTGILALGFGHAMACPTTESADSSRIAVAGGSITEIIYLLNAQDRIVAVDTTSNYPTEANQLPSIGYVRNLSAEGLLSLIPSMILGEHDMGPPEALSQLNKVGVTTLVIPEKHTSQGIVDKVRCVAQALSMSQQAEALITTQLQPKIEALANVGRSNTRVALLLGIRDGVPLAAGANTSGDGLISMAGATNVFANIEGWKPISLEAMAAANPDVIVIPKRGVDDAGGIDALAKIPALRLTKAVAQGRIVSMDGMAMLGFGPRTISAAVELSVRLAEQT